MKGKATYGTIFSEMHVRCVVLYSQWNKCMELWLFPLALIQQAPLASQPRHNSPCDFTWCSDAILKKRSCAIPQSRGERKNTTALLWHRAEKCCFQQTRSISPLIVCAWRQVWKWSNGHTKLKLCWYFTHIWPTNAAEEGKRKDKGFVAVSVVLWPYKHATRDIP